MSKSEAIKVLSESVKCVDGVFIYIKNSRNTQNKGLSGAIDEG